MSRSQGLEEFDFELENERARWLRKRFMWLCALSILIAMLSEGPSLFDLPNKVGRARWASLATIIGDTICICIYVWAWVYAKRTPPNFQKYMRMALRLVIGVGIIGMAYVRVSVELDPEQWVEVFHNPATAFLMIAPFMILFNHGLTSLLMPWRLMEALWPGVVLVGVVWVVALVDIATGRIALRPQPIMLLVATLLTPLPGSMICWFRYSRFHRSFQIRFFSKAYKQVQADLEGARRVHESCLPSPRAEGRVRVNYAYEPMRQIGGDMLFVHPQEDLDAPRVSAVMIDVMGHGIAAALTVNRIVGELERLYAERPDSRAGEMLKSLNRYMYLTMASHGVYATAMCVRVDAERGVIEYASGGHPPALLRRRDGSQQKLDSTAMMLGVVGSEDFEAGEEVHSFAEGDVLIAFTDGAVEARDRAARHLGMKQFEQAFAGICGNGAPAEQWPGKLLERVREHRAEAPAGDDTLVMCIFRSADKVMTRAGETPAAEGNAK